MNSDLYQNIQTFYDDSSELWESVWGEHMHHGFYGFVGTHQKDQQQAQVDLIEALLKWSGITQAEQILDAGCGIGGSALYLCDRYQAAVTGITLSPKQAARATERAAAAGLSDRAQFQVDDVLNTSFPDEQFDFIWSMESGEHYPDKGQFFKESYRLLKPGGTLLMATWCHRPTHSLAGSLTEAEQLHLASIYKVYHLPYVLSLPDYDHLARQAGYADVQTADWSDAVAPFWDAVIKSSLQWDAIVGLVQAGWPTLQGALALGLMRWGFQWGLIRYGVLSARKE
ncbi:methyltransferase domain-containing protein [Oscillatoria sp. CS-180]|uniref:methyltransferase domain-containing protein n=1 Tax=Oscillatoria sp. CS-180 TaxID=3021720 RepID=UPI00232DB34C|nr:methyltransferase domain-containing protein [Oscillatoria sp. CS-180]MDB9525981.1 methyltransferase domain-containing protein [Oscillatoria sp. CS-180]